MNWDDYLKLFISQEDSRLSNIPLSWKSEEGKSIPLYIRFSEKIIEDTLQYTPSNLLAIRYSNDPAFVFDFLVFKTIRDIFNENVVAVSDIRKLKRGQKLCFGKVTVEFDGFSESAEDGEIIWFKIRRNRMKKGISDPLTRRGQMLDVRKMPRFKLAISSAQLSNESEWDEEWKKPENFCSSGDSLIEDLLLLGPSQQTAIAYVGSTAIVGKVQSQITLSGRPLLEVLSIMRAKFSGTLKSISGNENRPQIILASDPCSVLNAVNGNPSDCFISTVCIDGKEYPDLSSYFDEISELRNKGIKVLYFSPENERISSDALKEIGFKLLDLTSPLLQSKHLSFYETDQWSKDIVLNAQNRKVSLLECHSEEIVDAYEIMKKYDDFIDGDSYPSLAKTCFESFERMFFSELRRCLPNLGLPSQTSFHDEWKKQIADLKKGAFLIPNCDFVSDMERADKEFEILYGREECHKQSLINDFLCSHHGRNALIVHGGATVEDALWVYQEYLKERGLVSTTEIAVFSDDVGVPDSHFDNVVVCGWLKREVMTRLLLSNVAPNYFILVHRCERNWAINGIEQINLNAHGIPEARNPEAPSGSEDVISLHFDVPDSAPIDATDDGQIYERFKKRGYSDFKAQAQDNDKIVRAEMLVFNNGQTGCFTEYFTFTRLNGLLNGEGELEVGVTPADLKIGDVIAFFSSAHDKIKEIADQILERKGLLNAREIATSWRKTLLMQQHLGLSDLDIYQALIHHGLSLSFPAVRKWLYDDNAIRPRNLGDIDVIAKTFEDPFLSEQIDQVKEMATEVASAHISAGHQLSASFHQDINFQEIVSEYSKSINSYLAAKTIEIAGIGQVQIAVLIDKGEFETFAYSKTNKWRKEID